MYNIYNNLLNNIFGRCLPKTKHEEVAVNIADAISSITCSKKNVPSIATPTTMANIATKKDATVACTCTNAILPITIRITSLREVILPKLTCVERRDARHISRLPLRPSSDGTRMNSSVISLKTRHFYAEYVSGIRNCEKIQAYLLVIYAIIYKYICINLC